MIIDTTIKLIDAATDEDIENYNSFTDDEKKNFLVYYENAIKEIIRDTFHPDKIKVRVLIHK